MFRCARFTVTMSLGYPAMPPSSSFLDDFDPDLRRSLMVAIRNVWTHTSTAIEGNTLTLGESAFVLEQGLTISGKPLKDHQEVVGHARALDLLLDLARSDRPLDVATLFELHRAVQTAVALDAQCPIGGWKNSPNGTQTVDAEGRIRFIEYAVPADVPALMESWLESMTAALDGNDASTARYADLHLAFVRVHPFCDGNGRMARLLANLPRLRAGRPPIVIAMERRAEYLRLLASYDLAVGPAKGGIPLLPEKGDPEPFRAFCAACVEVVDGLVAEAKKTQAGRPAR